MFVVVALAWIPVFYLFSYTNGFWRGSLIGGPLESLLTVMMSPMAVAVAAYESVSHAWLGYWWSGTLRYVGLGLSAATWATLITVAYVHIRRLRERRAVSKGA